MSFIKLGINCASLSIIPLPTPFEHEKENKNIDLQWRHKKDKISLL
jgi:hypothetical protein